MFKKFLASIGIGKATVDTILLDDRLTPGQDFRIEVVIKGGDVEQHINGIELAVMASAKAEVEIEDDEVEVDKSLILQHWVQELDMVIQPGETLSEQFTLTLHPELPTTSIGGRNTRVWLQTGLDIKSGVDGSDKDVLVIEPTATQKAVLLAIENQGFSLFKADIEVGQVSGHNFHSSLPCYQEYEFKPDSTSFFGVKELEVTFVDTGEETGVLLELDRAFTGDGYKSVTIPNHCQSVADVEPYIRSLLS